MFLKFYKKVFENIPDYFNKKNVRYLCISHLTNSPIINFKNSE